MDEVEKQLRKMPKKQRERIPDAMERIILRDFSALDLIKLKGYKNVFRVRVGDYRIIFHDDGREVLFEAVVRRNEHTYDDF